MSQDNIANDNSHQITLTHNARECLGGRILYAGTSVLVNPNYPSDVMEDTPQNREEFKKRSHIWRDETRFSIVQDAVQELIQQGLGRLGNQSIRVKTVAEKVCVDANEVQRVFQKLKETGEYEVYKTDSGEVAIRTV